MVLLYLWYTGKQYKFRIISVSFQTLSDDCGYCMTMSLKSSSGAIKISCFLLVNLK